MQWVELAVSTGSDRVEEIASLLGRYGQGGAAIEEWQSESTGEKDYIVKVYLPHGRSFQDTYHKIEQDLARSGFRLPLTQRILKSADWFESLKRHFGIIEIGQNFIIKPGWIDPPLPPSTRTVIELDPGAAFGTGLHPTTKLCLLRLEKHLQPGMSAFDLGTGSGILAIAAAKLGASSVLALDIDPVAVKVAASNARANKVEKLLQIKRGTLSLRFIKARRGSFDLTLANITARAISDLGYGFAAVLKPGGILIVSGINLQGLDEVLINLAMADLTLEALDREGEWCAIFARKGRI